ncbi:FemAB family XrtA/PEP-CTERM system-associated protein [Desulfobacula phenolica]|uniref:FemAB-related protein, PEP-CTERM system-associated n=1 Tax=Desulfobacula phenolica TaxID=90732 RepID=A0A1H2ENP0_9BACT|nr:FemAB family XrtA/PEP-CTERM system-associated protein [Desulfobacula phenolica]SDT96730.1 FemAB-related protein, PEP-CTERM system-associated [Desulfobacula phenolica]
MILNIRITDRSDFKNWDNYVLNHPSGSVFHLTAWKSVIEKSFGHRNFYLIGEQQGKICGIFPIFEIKSFLFGHYFISIPFAEIGGVLADSIEIEQSLIKEALKIKELYNGQYLEIRNRKEIQGLRTKFLYYNFRKEISSDHDENLKAIPRKSRAMVKNAIKKGLFSETGHHLLPEFYNILSLNYHRLGTPIFSKQLFKNFLAEFKESTNILVIKTDKGELAAAVLFFLFKDQMLPYYAGSDFSFRQLGSNDFMYWELMKLAVDKGCRVFDYGRSKEDTGSFHFKKHWGFKPEPLAYQYHIAKAENLPNLSPANPKYQKKIKVWQKMPHSFTKIIGPFISRDLA